jgi:hypothetical protein
MRKINFLIFCLPLFSQVSGQWSTSGTNIYNTNSGNVGVGISAPVGKFSVYLSNTDYTNTNGAGSHLMLSNPSSSGQTVVSSYINSVLVGKWRTDYAGNMNFVAGAGGYVFYTGGDFPTGTPKMYISNAGNVGIGTTTRCQG